MTDELPIGASAGDEPVVLTPEDEPETVVDDGEELGGES